MAKKDHVSETPATALLKASGIPFTEHPYEYLEHGGAQHSAEVLGLDPFTVVKTLVMEDEKARPSRYGCGFIGVPPCGAPVRVSKWRCGPVELPVLPT